MTKTIVTWLTAAVFSGLFFLSSCKKYAADASFYFWRTRAALSPGEKAALKTHHVHTLYVRFFDVDTPQEDGQPKPMGVIDSLELLPPGLTVIPVVYITNRSFLRLRADTEAVALAHKVLRKVNSMHTNYPELQIDCDWSEKSRLRYFLFLETIRKQLPPAARLTATIRLHQVKYPEKTGVPPVDGGMLMFYNMGNLHLSEGPNSIFDVRTAKAYTPYISSYKLHLDAALPIFRWYVHYRNGKIKGLISKKQLPELKDTSYFYTATSTRYSLKKAGIVNGVAYEAGDVLKQEALSDEQLLEAAALLQKSLYQERRNIVLYDLDDLNIQYYETNTLKAIYSSFH